MHLRGLQDRLLNALGDTPVVCLAGAGRTGKTTLAMALQAELAGSAFHTFADPATLAFAAADPAGFLERLPAQAVLDEAQRAPGLVPLLKAAVAGGRKFLLTTPGPLPGLARNLGWELEAFTLWPLAQAEREGVLPSLVDLAFQGDLARLRLEPQERRDLLGRILAGGYPGVPELAAGQREAWFHGYLAALAQGELRTLTDLREVRQILRLLAHPGADPALAKRCGDVLESLHVMAALPSGPGGPYRCFNDSALQAHVLGMVPAALETRPGLAAPLLETFAVMELVKTAPWSQTRPALSHLDAGGRNLVILENHRRDLVAFATDAAATVQPEAFQGLLDLRGKVGDRLRAGIVLHLGEAFHPAGPGLWAVPLQALWGTKS